MGNGHVSLIYQGQDEGQMEQDERYPSRWESERDIVTYRFEII